ncbi:TRAP transporter permease [Salinibius halmophilus]|uniref:TRAP transporter permease n=1 Tax=Salinibius halmophilus TaxID=1853216 RepID=UPI000E65F5DB|nr:TRAP transporter permease [Salinibius halmophilus]
MANHAQSRSADIDALIAKDTGGRIPLGPSGKLILVTAAVWSLFQLWIVSPLPFMLKFGVFNEAEARSIHLTFAMFLAFLAYPLRAKSPQNSIPIYDWILALIAAGCASYLFVFYEDLALRPNLPTTADIVVGVLGILLLLEAARRTLGPPLVIIASLFLLYSLAGPYMPDMISHGGVSLSGLINHQWLTSSGVFGVALGVSTSFVFLFVLFGALLDKAGAGNWFIRVAFASLGHMRGGPAKAAVVSSGLTGLISGSSIANVVTTGTFTIPLMKRVGFTPEKAGAVEVSSSVNGQLMPPVMGAAAFLMVEYVGISYVEVIKHAFLPALISYIALIYLVHLEALKAGMQGLQRVEPPKPIVQKLISFLTGLLLVMAIGAVTYYGLGWLKPLLGGWALLVISLLLVAVYVGLVRVASTQPSLDPEDAMDELPRIRPTVLAGLQYLLPVVVLVWCLMIERFSPGLSAFWASVLMIFIVATQPWLISKLANESTEGMVKRGLADLTAGLISGARNMVGIGIATATAGIIVGAVSQTGIGLVLADVVEVLSMGNLLLMLLLTALLSLILGMGLPTTANYIVVSALMVPVVLTLGEQAGLIVPLVAVHLFVFYFGIMADVTPPVGLASFAAAAVSKGKPIKTGVTAFFYSLRTALLPFLFIFNTDLLLIDVPWWKGVIVFVTATIAMLLFSAATMNYWFTKSRWYESVLLLLIAFTLFRPGFWMDRIYPPTEQLPSSQLEQVIEQKAPGDTLRLWFDGEDIYGDPVNYVAQFKVPEAAGAQAKLDELGLTFYEVDGELLVDIVGFSSPAERAGVQFDQRLVSVEKQLQTPPKELAWIPALILLFGVYWLQRQRKLGMVS